MNRLLAFYYGGAPDDRGRTLAEILRQDDVWLEHTHDCIQWLFPMRVASGVNPSAPTVTDEVARAFQTDELLRRHLLASFVRMLSFFGLQRQDGAIVQGPNWPQRKRDWFTTPTHNSLRITRILTSLATLG
ncbi:opioid growth factor receptor-related protein, partial [Acinetobacter baumannii]|uniref:opioid growth factor receptor-related protein n=1 Tax=Acinetobacter baumannii TaxID=470 RepID=UPI001A7E28A4